MGGKLEAAAKVYTAPASKLNPQLNSAKSEKLNLRLSPSFLSSTRSPNPDNLLLETTKPKKDSPWKTGIYLTAGGASLLTGTLLIEKHEGGSREKGLGVGLATFGISSLGLELVDKIGGGEPMPKWAKITTSIGVGIFAGLGYSFFGTFDTGGLADNTQRFPVDEFGP